MENKKKLTGVVFTALFAALIAAGVFIQIPLPGGVPITIQDMMAMLSGLMLGPIYGTLAVAVFLLLGIIGLPVFTGKAGIQVLIAGPTGGFLWGYLIAAFAAGLFLSLLLPRKKVHSNLKQYLLVSAAAVLATVIVFAGGIIGFMRVTGSGLGKTLAAVLIPFIPGNVIKLIIMIPLTKKFRPIIANYIY